MKNTSPLEKFVFIGLAVAILITFAVLAKPLLVPLVFAVLFAFALSPLASRFESWGFNQFFSSLTTVLGILTVLVVALGAISYVLSDIYTELPNIQQRVEQGIQKLFDQFTSLTGISMDVVQDNFWNNSSDIVSPVWDFIQSSITLSLITLGNVFLILFYTFFLLYYRKGIIRVLKSAAGGHRSEAVSKLLLSIRNTIRDYFTGIFIVMLILGVLNSLGLWIIGLDYAIFWGFVAALLVIIPYVGTAIGGILPFLYALATLDSLWQPAAIAIMYYTIQQVEGNYITPKVVGSEIDLNILSILLGMIAGGLIWGVPGIILAAPVAGVLQVLFHHFKETRPVARLMSSKLYKWKGADAPTDT